MISRLRILLTSARLRLSLGLLRIARWRRARDYRWDELTRFKIKGAGNLQEYWLRDPATGQMRVEADLLASNKIVATKNGRWHIAHLPRRSGAEGLKENWTEVEWTTLEAELALRIESARETKVSPGGEAIASDLRAQFDGVVVRKLPAQPGKPLHVRCARAILLEDPLADGVPLGPGANFREAVFLQPADFRRHRFEGDACFDGTWFRDEVCFGHKAPFRGRVSFDRTRFQGAAHFSGAIFEQPCDFRRTRFFSACQMQGAKFRQLANFTSARFFGAVDFSRALFSSRALFRKAEFHRRATFMDTKFLHSAGFYSAVFHDLPAFEDARLSTNTTFSNARFRKVGAVVGVSWITLWASVWIASWLTGLGSTDASPLAAEHHWLAWLLPLIMLVGASRFWITDRDLDRFVRAFRSLSQQATDFNNRADASKFLREELRAQRLRSWANPLERFLSLLYDVLSGYGHSLVGPIAALSVIFATFAIGYWAWERAPITDMPQQVEQLIQHPNPANTLRDAAEFSARNIFQPFGVWVSPLPVPGRCDFRDRLLAQSKPTSGRTREFRLCRAAWMATVSEDDLMWHRLGVRLTATTQSILTALLLFLAGVAARRRFQISQ